MSVVEEVMLVIDERRLRWLDFNAWSLADLAVGPFEALEDGRDEPDPAR